VTIEQVMKPLHHYWPQARDKILKRGATTEIAPNIDMSFYGHDEFETKFPKKNAKKLQLIQDQNPGYEKFEKSLAFAYKTGKMYGTINGSGTTGVH